MADATYQKCPGLGCGIGREQGHDHIVYRCSKCGKIVGHKSSDGTTSCIAQDCTASKTGDHYGLVRVGIVKRL